MNTLWKIAVLVIILTVHTTSGLSWAVTYNLAASVDDTFAEIEAADQNLVTLDYVRFGDLDFSGAYYEDEAYLRFASDIPVGSTVTSAKLQFYATFSNAATVNRLIRALAQAGTPAWRGAGGFNTTNYANGTALNGITLITGYTTWYSVAAWTANNWYDSPDITARVQAQIDDANYDPSDSVKKYVGYRLQQSGWAPCAICARIFASYDSGANSARLVVEYTPPVGAGAAQVIIIRR